MSRMRLESLITNLTGGELLDSLLPDFVLSFAFFTAVIYAAVGKRFNHQRSATMLAVAIGLAFSISLVWWEYLHDYSIKDLGPIAVGFAVILLGGVMYQAIRQVGGTWAGAGMAIGGCLIVGSIVGLDWHVGSGLLQSVTAIAVVGGILAFITHRGGLRRYAPRFASGVADVRHDLRDLHEDEYVSDRLTRGFRRLRKEADVLHQRPERADDIMLQLKRMLPAEGWLTERMARLRARAHFMRSGHIARFEELQDNVSRLQPKARRRAGRELRARYTELKIDGRIERLDKTVAAYEKRIRDLTQQAEEYLAAHEYQKLAGVLEDATKLQKHNSKILRIIERTEAHLLNVAGKVAKQPGGVRSA